MGQPGYVSNETSRSLQDLKDDNDQDELEASARHASAATSVGLPRGDSDADRSLHPLRP